MPLDPETGYDYTDDIRDREEEEWRESYIASMTAHYTRDLMDMLHDEEFGLTWVLKMVGLLAERREEAA